MFRLIYPLGCPYVNKRLCMDPVKLGFLQLSIWGGNFLFRPNWDLSLVPWKNADTLLWRVFWFNSQILSFVCSCRKNFKTLPIFLRCSVRLRNFLNQRDFMNLNSSFSLVFDELGGLVCTYFFNHRIVLFPSLLILEIIAL